MRRYILTVTCPDRIGIVAAVSSFVANHDGSVLEAAQHGDLTTTRFFLRMEITADSLSFGPDEFSTMFQPIADEFSMDWHLSDTDIKKKVVMMVSAEDHCLADLLYRWRSGALDCEIACVISNHETLRPIVEWHGIDYFHVPVPSRNVLGQGPPRDGTKRDSAFKTISKLIDQTQGDVVVLARFMQILPQAFCEKYQGRIINIHHSFLPSFAGARPYHQAFERGVKIIGATCHYVTEDLDAGPIIEQDTQRIDHTDTPDELLRIGRDIERTVLARGLRWHLQDRILINGARTVVFR